MRESVDSVGTGRPFGGMDTGRTFGGMGAGRTFGIVGGDSRFVVLARLLEQDGHLVLTYGLAGQGVEGTVSQDAEALEAALSADTVFLPLPLCRADGKLNCAGASLSVTDVLNLLSRNGSADGSRADSGADGNRAAGQKRDRAAGQKRDCTPSRQVILAGMVPDEVRREAERRGVRLVDYARRESFAIGNAAATVDGAVCLTVQRTGESLLGKRCLVLGFGRIGKLLCLRLRAIGAEVTAAARKGTDRAWVRAMGFAALDTGRLSGRLDGFDVVYNTVPAEVLDASLLEELAGVRPGTAGDDAGLEETRRDAAERGAEKRGAAERSAEKSRNAVPPLLVELASRPGFRRDAAERLGLRVLEARGLPGKLVPSTAAAVLRDTIYEVLAETEF